MHIAYYDRKYSVMKEVETIKKEQKLLHAKKIAKLREKLREIDEDIDVLLTKHKTLLHEMEVELELEKCYITEWSQNESTT